jgi:hypothetical protein
MKHALRFVVVLFTATLLGGPSMALAVEEGQAGAQGETQVGQAGAQGETQTESANQAAPVCGLVARVQINSDSSKSTSNPGHQGQQGSHQGD